MDALTLKIIEGDRAAIMLARTCITTPTLINTDIRQGALYALPLMCETNQRAAAAEVSESLIISTNAKENISDNVAPGSPSWDLSGYIQGIKSLEPTSFFMPLMQQRHDILWNWFNHGAVLTFKDGNAQIFKRVVIKNLKTSQQKDAANGIPFSLTLKELNVMETSLLDIADDITENINKAKKSIPEIGSWLGLPLTLGGTVAEAEEEAS